MKKKTDTILIVITLILVIVLAVGFFYDRDSALLDRTNRYSFSTDENLKVDKIEKAGFLYARAAYEARVKILDGKSDEYICRLAYTYGYEGQIFDSEQFKQYKADVLNKVTIQPNPSEGSFIWVLGAPLEENSTKNIVYIVDIEGPGEAYIYLYYSRK